MKSWLQALARETRAFRVERVAAAGGRNGHGAAYDYVAKLAPLGGRRRVVLLVEVKSRLTPQQALAACAQAVQRRRRVGRSTVFVLACPYISPRVAEICRQHDVGYLDGAGNCDIRTAGLMIHVAGRPNVAPDTRPLASPFTPKASRVARLLLSDPQREWQVQEIASGASVSLGLAFKAKDALIREGFAAELRGRVVLRDGRGLLDAWASSYKSPTRRTPLYVMDDVMRVEQRAAQWCTERRVMYGLAGLSGAWRLAPMVRHAQACICVLETPARDVAAGLATALEAKQVESGSNLLVLCTADEGLFLGAQTVDDVLVLSPVQLYLELHLQRGRGQEAADELVRRVIEPTLRPSKRALGKDIT